MSLPIGGVIFQPVFIWPRDIPLIPLIRKKNFCCSLPGLIRFFLKAQKVPLIPPGFIVLWPKQLLFLRMEVFVSFSFRGTNIC